MRALLRKHAIVSGLSAAALALIILGWFLSYRALRDIQEPLILHYDSSYAGAGINQIGGIENLAYMRVTGVIFVLLDAVLAFTLDKRHPLWGKVAAAAALFFAGLLFAGFLAIMFVNS